MLSYKKISRKTMRDLSDLIGACQARSHYGIKIISIQKIDSFYVAFLEMGKDDVNWIGDFLDEE